MTTVDPPISDQELFHLSLNPKGKSTIVLIHGVFGSSRDWDVVYTRLAPTYHVLVPDLPGHGKSQSLKPFSIAHSATLINHLIQTHALNAKAHIVGASLGAHIAIRLAAQYPASALTVVVSGFQVSPVAAGWLEPYLPYAFWAMPRVENLAPRPVVRWLLDGTDITRADTGPITMDLCRAIVAPRPEAEKWPRPWPARTLVIAAGKAGVLPTADHAGDAVRLAGIGREGNDGTVAVTHRLMRHAWMRQDPELFARTVRAWVEGEGVLEGFERL